MGASPDLKKDGAGAKRYEVCVLCDHGGDEVVEVQEGKLRGRG